MSANPENPALSDLGTAQPEKGFQSREAAKASLEADVLKHWDRAEQGRAKIAELTALQESTQAELEQLTKQMETLNEMIRNDKKGDASVNADNISQLRAAEAWKLELIASIDGRANEIEASRALLRHDEGEYRKLQAQYNMAFPEGDVVVDINEIGSVEPTLH